MDLTEFWRYIFVECAAHKLYQTQEKTGIEADRGMTPYMDVFGAHGLGVSGALQAMDFSEIPAIYMKFFLKSLDCMSEIWSYKNSRFLMFVYRVVFGTDKHIDRISHRLCSECNDFPSLSVEACVAKHTLYKLLLKSDESLVSNVARETLIKSLLNAKEVIGAAPSHIVEQLPTKNRKHAVEMFLRMAYIFNNDVQTQNLQIGIKWELRNLFTDKQPFGRPH